MTPFVIGLLLLVGMNIVANLYIPVPLTPTTLWIGQFHHPFIVVIVSTISTVIGWFIFQGYIYRGFNKQAKLIQKLPQTYFRFFGKHTLWWVFLINAVPFPVDFIRLIAVANKYPPTPIAWAIGAGRLIRNSLLVFAGAWLFQYQSVFIGTVLFLFLVPLIASGLTFLRQRFRRPAETPTGDPQPDLM